VGRVSLEIAPNPPPGIKLGIKVDNHGYHKKIKCLILIYNHDYQKKSNNTKLLHIIMALKMS